MTKPAKKPNPHAAALGRLGGKPRKPGAAFMSALTKAIKFHRTNKDDPYGIRPAVMIALTEVRDAMRYELNQ